MLCGTAAAIGAHLLACGKGTVSFIRKQIYANLKLINVSSI